jgi:7,8-dihydropterin-6-yl-methyl-4-(beta-D-ribofuranosyl)aminobenzene 5'-phosphate synthase
MKLTCLVDNTVQFRSAFWGEHGLAFLIDSEEGRVLFDTGAGVTVLCHNMEVAGIAPDSITALALSHAHTDHTGGLPALLERQPGLPIFANSDLLRERFSRRAGRMRPRGLPMSAKTLRRLADLRLSDESQEILPGIWTTGEIVERPEPEGRSAGHFVRREIDTRTNAADFDPDARSTSTDARSTSTDARSTSTDARSTSTDARSTSATSAEWVPDPYRDDMSLVLDGSRGLVLVCGCCHAGLLNTLAHVQRAFGRAPVTVIGGTHLVSADEAHLHRLIEVLQEMGAPALYLNHCTGQAAYVVLAQAFGDRVAPCPVGTVLEL